MGWEEQAGGRVEGQAQGERRAGGGGMWGGRSGAGQKVGQEHRQGSGQLFVQALALLRTERAAVAGSTGQRRAAGRAVQLGAGCVQLLALDNISRVRCHVCACLTTKPAPAAVSIAPFNPAHLVGCAALAAVGPEAGKHRRLHPLLQLILCKSVERFGVG